MIYNAGTISFSGNTVTGSGTSFTAPASQVRIGQTLLIASNPVQLVQITAINSATSLTVTPAAAPAVTDQKYAILVTDSLSVDGLAQSISQLINEYDENIGAWEAFASTTANQRITVTINGVSMSIPSLGSLEASISGMAKKGVNKDITSLEGLTTALSVKQGGTGGTTQASAREGLGLKKGFPVSEYNSTSESVIDNVVAKMRGFSLATLQNILPMTGEFYEIPNNAPTLWVGANDTWFLMSVHYLTRGIRVMSGYGTAGVSTTRLLLDNLTTTVDANGFIKKASPVVRLTNDHRGMSAGFLEDFSLSGCAATNMEAEGVTAEKIATGVYEVRGAVGLHADGWTIEIPQDSNGNRLCFVETQSTQGGTIIVSVFKRRFDSETAMIVAGEPMDIPAGRWIDLRLEMPESSVFNQKLKAAQQGGGADSSPS